ncbi:hypothetical protein AB6A40_008641 [Gnathostoma spinigerum]|uniref:Uncharacterized protein n=1 Tax=Gnathostoma spinigerum TaxID=75299 RepID=A0ABD6EZ01_9BILA
MIGESAESDKFFELIGRTFNLSESLNNKLTSRRKMKQLVDLISLGKLEEAFYLVKELFSSKSAACGQLELMSAALNVGDTTLLKNVFSLIQNKRGKNDALLDFGLVLLENGKFEQASRVFSADELHITDAKLSLFVSREADTKRLDVLAMLFSNLNKEGKASVNGLNSLLRQLLSLIDSKSTANQTTSFDLLSIIQESIKESGFPVEKSLQLRLAKLFPRKADSGSSSTSVSHKS